MAIVNLDKVQASYNGNLESLQFSADKTNGIFAHVGDLVTGEREVKEGVQPTEATVETDEVVLLACPEVMYDERKYKKSDFVLSAGVAGRAYHLTEGDIVTLTSDLFSAAPTVGQYAVSQYGADILSPSTDGTIRNSGDTGDLTPKFRAKVIEETTLDGNTAYAIQVLSV